MKSRLLTISLLLAILATTVQAVAAPTQHYSVQVPGGGRQQVLVDLKKSDVVQFYISSVTSTLGKDQIDFSILLGGPDGTVVYSQSNVYQLRDSYFAQSDGAYYLTFTNTNLLLEKTVEIDVTTTAGSPCIIATAAYGSELAPPVQFLRTFRDHEVSHTYLGSQFVQAFNAWYYSWAPPVARAETQNPTLRTGVRALITPLVGILVLSSGAFHVLAPINAEMSVLLAGLLASALLGLVYLSPLMLTATYVSKRRVTRKTIAYVAAFGVILTLAATLTTGTFALVQILTGVLLIETMLIVATTPTRLAQSLRNGGKATSSATDRAKSVYIEA